MLDEFCQVAIPRLESRLTLLGVTVLSAQSIPHPHYLSNHQACGYMLLVWFSGFPSPYHKLFIVKLAGSTHLSGI